MKAVVDGWAAQVAGRLIAWTANRIHPARADWGNALAAEADQMDSGWGRLRWAINALPLAWSMRRAPEPNGDATMQMRATFASLNREGADLWSMGVTLGLVSLVVVFSATVTPLFMRIAAQFGFALPLPARLVIGASQNGLLVTLLSVLLVALLWSRGRQMSGVLPLRRLLLTTNVVCVLALAGLTTGIVSAMVAANRSIDASRRERAERVESERMQQRVARLRAAKAFDLPVAPKR